MKLGTHLPDGERRKPIDIEVCRTKVKVTTSKNRKQIDTFFVSAQYDERKKPMEVVGQRSRSYCPSTCSQLGFHTFGALLIFLIIHASIMVF
jgi:hypothetical protein